MNDPDLRRLFGTLKEEDRGRAPSFDAVMAEARKATTDPEGQTPATRVRPWWQAVPLGAALAAAGIGAIALVGTGSPAEVEFREAVAWTRDNPLFTTLRGPSDVLLEEPAWSLVSSGSPSPGMLTGLSDLLSLDPGLDDGRNES